METRALSPQLHCLILAAGASRRLGQPKQLQYYQGQTLLEKACRLGLTQTASVHVTLDSSPGNPMRNIIRDLPVHILENQASQEGMASSIRLGIQALPAGVRGLLILLCDQYLLETSDLDILRHHWWDAPESIVAARYSNTVGVPVIWPAWLFPELEQLQGDRGARYLLQQHQQRVITVNMPRASQDLDTPGQQQQLSARNTQQKGISND